MVWNTTGSPTTADGVSAEGTPALGDFSSGITGLLPGTTYYARAYVTNDVDTAYGSDAPFTTLAPSLTVGISPLSATGTCGSNTVWTITVQNTGSVNADVVLVELTPGAWLDADPAGSTAGLTDLGGGVFGWEFTNLASGSSQQLTLAATLNPDGLPNQADCSSAPRNVNAQANWGAGTTGDAIDGNPTTRGYDKLNGTWASAAPAVTEMPNLIATDITADTSCTGDGSFLGSISVDMQNIGNADAVGPFTVQVTDGKGWTGTGVYAGTLGAGLTDSVSIDTSTWSLNCSDCSPYAFNGTVDLNNDICECNETDNSFGPVSHSLDMPDLEASANTLAISCSLRRPVAGIRIHYRGKQRVRHQHDRRHSGPVHPLFTGKHRRHSDGAMDRDHQRHQHPGRWRYTNIEHWQSYRGSDRRHPGWVLQRFHPGGTGLHHCDLRM